MLARSSAAVLLSLLAFGCLSDRSKERPSCAAAVERRKAVDYGVWIPPDEREALFRKYQLSCEMECNKGGPPEVCVENEILKADVGQHWGTDMVLWWCDTKQQPEACRWKASRPDAQAEVDKLKAEDRAARDEREAREAAAREAASSPETSSPGPRGDLDAVVREIVSSLQGKGYKLVKQGTVVTYGSRVITESLSFVAGRSYFVMIVSSGAPVSAELVTPNGTSAFGGAKSQYGVSSVAVRFSASGETQMLSADVKVTGVTAGGDTVRLLQFEEP